MRANRELFGVGVPAISKHLENIYFSGELDQNATISILEAVQLEGKREVKRKLEYYNLDSAISVGYRINQPIFNHLPSPFGAVPSLINSHT
jgi:hypothetical protein